MVRVMLRLVADAILVASLLFGAAGTVAWRQAWILLAVMLAVRAVGALAVHFALGWTMKNLALRASAFAVSVVRLQRERAHPDTGHTPTVSAIG